MGRWGVNLGGLARQKELKTSHQTRKSGEKNAKNCKKLAKITRNFKKLAKIARNWCVLDSD
jgi:hypothetical protein